MSECEQLEVSYSRKIQLDQFEPITHYAGATVTLEEGDDADEVYNEYADRVEDMVERSIAARVTQKKLENED